MFGHVNYQFYGQIMYHTEKSYHIKNPLRIDVMTYRRNGLTKMFNSESSKE